MASPGRVTIELSNEEALVLFGFLQRFHGEQKYPFEDQAEQRVLWDLECVLEKELVAPLSRDYDEALRAAREKVRDSE